MPKSKNHLGVKRHNNEEADNMRPGLFDGEIIAYIFLFITIWMAYRGLKLLIYLTKDQLFY